MLARQTYFFALVVSLSAAGPVDGASAPAPSPPAPTAALEHIALPPFSEVTDCLRLADRSTAATEHLCNELLRVWESPTAAHAGKDDPLQIAFGGGLADRGIAPPTAVLPAVFLGRLLAIPHLLPPRLTGGLVLENVAIEGTLDFTDALVTVPLTFRHVWLRPQTLVLGETGLQALALDARQATFSGSLRFLDSTVLGHIRISDSRLAHGLSIESTVLSTRSDARNGTLQPGFASEAPAIAIRGSTLAAGLAIEDSQIFGTRASLVVEDSVLGPRLRVLGSFAEHDIRIERSEIGSVSIRDADLAGHLILDRNRIEGLDLASSKFRARLWVNQSEIGSVSIQDAEADGHLIVEHNRTAGIDIGRSTFRSTPYVNYNTIAGNLELVGIGLQLDNGARDPEIAANQIGGQLWVMPDILDHVQRLDLTYNIARLATVYPPKGWAGMLDLSNGKIGSRLKLGRFNQDASPPSLRRNEALDGCSGVRPAILVNLTNVESDVLAWNFPLSCAVQWDGAGLHYRYWGDPDLKPSPENEEPGLFSAMATPGPADPATRTERDFADAFKDWRHVLYDRSSGPLSVMADYLHERGDFSASRDLLRDAKAADYEGKWLVYYMLWPTGFGAKPERALYWLFLAWLAGVGIYWWYRRQEAAGWPTTSAEPGSDGLEAADAAPTPEGEHGSPASGRSQSAKGTPPEQPSLVPGFMQYQRDKRPADFSLAVFSADALLPVLNLHAYTEYYPRSHLLRLVSFVQHVAGWYLLTIFLASATVL